MKQLVGDLWDFYDKGKWVVITTNGSVNSQGNAVMGKGIALQAKKRMPELPKRLAVRLRVDGNHTFVFPDIRIITLPVKHEWHQTASPVLIARSIHEMFEIVNELKIQEVYMPRPGCGNGKLAWSSIVPMLSTFLTDGRFIIVELNS